MVGSLSAWSGDINEGAVVCPSPDPAAARVGGAEGLASKDLAGAPRSDLAAEGRDDLHATRSRTPGAIQRRFDPSIRCIVIVLTMEPLGTVALAHHIKDGRFDVAPAVSLPLHVCEATAEAVPTLEAGSDELLLAVDELDVLGTDKPAHPSRQLLKHLWRARGEPRPTDPRRGSTACSRHRGPRRSGRSQRPCRRERLEPPRRRAF